MSLNHDFIKLGNTRKAHLINLVKTAHYHNLKANHAESDAAVATAVRLYGKDSMLLAFGIFIYDVNNA